MGACLRHVEMIVRNQCFFMNFTFKYGEDGWEKKKLTQ